MDSSRYLVVNADDFGLSHSVNRGIIQAHEDGIVTSASLMVRAAAAKEAAAYGRIHPQLSVGLHLDLCEWKYVNGQWQILYEVVPATNAIAVAAEVVKQLDLFRRLMGRDPTHIDSHQHVHRDEPLRSILLQHAGESGVALRSFDKQIQYCGAFYGQSAEGFPYPEGISVAALMKVIRLLPAGVSELGCHPGYADDLVSTYRLEREMECATLCHPEIRAALIAESVSSISFAQAATLR